MPVACESVRVTGPDSIMSSALPAGGPSRISVNTTSASSRSTIRCAVVEPTNPPPTTVTFFLLIGCLSLSVMPEIQKTELHIRDNSIGKCRSAQLGSSGHQSLQVIGDLFLLNGFGEACLTQFSRLAPTHEFEHHGTRQHDGSRIDDVFIRVFRGSSMSCLK